MTFSTSLSSGYVVSDMMTGTGVLVVVRIVSINRARFYPEKLNRQCRLTSSFVLSKRSFRVDGVVGLT